MLDVVMMTPCQSLHSSIDGCDALIDVERAINGFIVTNYLIRIIALSTSTILLFTELG